MVIVPFFLWWKRRGLLKGWQVNIPAALFFLKICFRFPIFRYFFSLPQVGFFGKQNGGDTSEIGYAGCVYCKSCLVLLTFFILFHYEVIFELWNNFTLRRSPYEREEYFTVIGLRTNGAYEVSAMHTLPMKRQWTTVDGLGHRWGEKSS